ncbi:putative ribonuclease H protein [Sesamum angolense]|uniref:Ribonuclease H protein n=1 Tax=Sesamum angolense TaxID=2727404 RepID=A0AAE2BTM5_9LAMI|nr:putative ribonuclease H protein [Sesamum angolense]
MFKLQQKLFRLKLALKTWNIEVFGNIFDNIKQAEHKAKVAKQAYDANRSDELLIAMNKATVELTTMLRNDVKHRNANYNSDRIIWKVRQHIETIGRSNLAHLISWKCDKYLASSMGFSVKIQHKIKVLKVNWDKPERGWVKINTDGASKGNPGISGAGGIVRNEEGVAILAFYEFIGQATNMFSEVFGLYKALQLCNSRGINKIWIEVDAKNLIRLINCPSIAHWSLQNMLKEIRITLKSMEYRISHIYREGYKAADYLANLACSTQSSRVFRGELEAKSAGSSGVTEVASHTFALNEFSFRENICTLLPSFRLC